MEVRFCPACSQIVHPHYMYCPLCGTSLNEAKSFQDVLDRSLEPLEVKERSRALDRLSKLLDRLCHLEEGLDVLLQTQTSQISEDRSKDKLPFCR